MKSMVLNGGERIKNTKTINMINKPLEEKII